MIVPFNIYKYNTTDVRALVDPDEKSTWDNGIMRGDSLNVGLTSPAFIPFQVGDYCNLFNRRYRLNRDIKYSKIADRNWTYSLVLEGPYHQLGRCNFFTLDGNNNITSARFSLRLRPVDFIDLVVANMNRRFPDEQWTRGQVLDADYVTIDFDSQTCLQVLSTLADQCQTEFNIIGNTIHLIKMQPISGVTFAYGKGNTLYSIDRDNSDDYTGITTVLYAYGSSKNLGDNYRGGLGYLRMANSLFITKNINTYGPYERTLFFDGTNGLAEIFPHRTGTVTAVSANDTFTDTSIDFDLNDDSILMPGVSAKVTFNTGMLAGVTFDVNSYDNATKTIRINANTDSQTNPLPTDDLKPAAGDTYVFTDIIMPLSYINQAEADLKAAAVKWLNDNGPAKFVYTPGANPIAFKSEGIELQLGYSYQLVMDDAGVNRSLRVMAFSRNLRNPDLYTNIVLADTVVPQLPIVKIINKI